MNTPKWRQQILKELKRLIEFENANFDELHHGQSIQLKEEDVTDFIRERTRLYRETWILPLIDILIEGDAAMAKRLADIPY